MRFYSCLSSRYKKRFLPHDVYVHTDKQISVFNCGIRTYVQLSGSFRMRERSLERLCCMRSQIVTHCGAYDFVQKILSTQKSSVDVTCTAKSPYSMGNCRSAKYYGSDSLQRHLAPIHSFNHPAFTRHFCRSKKVLLGPLGLSTLHSLRQYWKAFIRPMLQRLLYGSSSSSPITFEMSG